MARPIAVLDIETTGTDPEKDRIIELAIVFIEEGQINPDAMTYRFNPGIPIDPEATAVHGITNADVAEAPAFADAAAEIAALLTPVDLAGFAPRILDLPMLAAEFERADVAWEFVGDVIDVRGLFVRQFPRDLTAAVRTYLGRDHAGAHGALPDTLATAQILQAQIAGNVELGRMTAEELAKFSNHDNIAVDFAGKLGLDPDGDLVYLFGKYKNEKVRDRRDYAAWMMEKGQFPPDTLRRLRAELDRIDGIRPKEYTHGTEAEIPF